MDVTWSAVADGQLLVLKLNRFEMFRFPIMKSAFCFTYVEFLTVPTTDLILLINRTIDASENNPSKINEYIKFINASVLLLGNSFAL